MNLNSNYERLDTVCRLCLSNESAMTIFNHDTIDIPNVVKFLTQLEITNDDAYTKLICQSCVAFIERVVEFKERCIQSYHTLQKQLQLGKSLGASCLQEFIRFDSQVGEDLHLEFIECEPSQLDKLASNGEENDDIERLETECQSNSDSSEKRAHLPAEDKRCDGKKLKKQSTAGKIFKKPLPEKDASKTAACPVCGEHVAGGKMMVKHHINSDHGDDGTLPKIRQCFFCPKAYSSYQLLKYHLNFHPQKVWQCPQCDKRIEKKNIFIDHLRIHADERHYECSVCGKRFTTLKYLSTHRMLHKAGEHNIDTNSHDHEAFADTFNENEEQLARNDHMQKEQTFCCRICPETFQLQTQLRVHIQCDHIPLDESLGRCYVCTVCTKAYASENHLMKHMEFHDMDVRWPCKCCTLQFRSKVKLKEHEKTHEQKESFLCIHCGREFPTSRYLSRHLQSHKKEKPKNLQEMYECEICGKRMKFKSNYTNHRKSHKTYSVVEAKKYEEPSSTETEQRKVYLCNICGHNCGSSSNLAVHLRRHNGQSICQCTVCGKGYPRKSDLVMHMRVHTGEKPFECTSCGKGFARLDKLRIHLRTHTGEKPYECPCGRAYAQRNDLKTHQKRNICGQNFDMAKLLAPYPTTICIKSPNRAKSPPRSVDHPQVGKGVDAPVNESASGLPKHQAELLVANDVVADMVESANWAHFMSVTFPKQDNPSSVDFDPMSFSTQPKLYS